MPLLEAMVMQSDTALEAPLASVLVADSTSLLGCIWLLVVVQVVHPHIVADTAVGRKNRSANPSGSRSTLAVAFEVRLDEFTAITQQIQHGILRCLCFPAVTIYINWYLLDAWQNNILKNIKQRNKRRHKIINSCISHKS